jgi:hypothetical protein
MNPPAFCLSGGRLSEFGNKAVEYRVWVHPQEGDDYFFRGKNLEKLLEKQAELLRDPKYALVEPIIAVVYDKKFKKYREVQIDGIDYC